MMTTSRETSVFFTPAILRNISHRNISVTARARAAANWRPMPLDEDPFDEARI
jgi:hypothetical protein